MNQEDAMHDILHGPIGVSDLKAHRTILYQIAREGQGKACAQVLALDIENDHEWIRAAEQIAHDTLYGPDDVNHVGNWRYYHVWD